MENRVKNAINTNVTKVFDKIFTKSRKQRKLVIDNVSQRSWKFKKNSKSAILESILSPNPITGVSEKMTIEEINDLVDFEVATNNGSPYFASDRCLGIKYIIVKEYDPKTSAISSVYTDGFAKKHVYRKPNKKVLTAIKSQRCVLCGTSTRVEVDHKNGRGYGDKDVVEDFQPLCVHCNKIKRERCKECKLTGKRYDAKKLHYPVSFTKGGLYYNSLEEGCDGCVLYDVAAFRKSLVKE